MSTGFVTTAQQEQRRLLLQELAQATDDMANAITGLVTVLQNSIAAGVDALTQQNQALVLIEQLYQSTLNLVQSPAVDPLTLIGQQVMADGYLSGLEIKWDGLQWRVVVFTPTCGIGYGANWMAAYSAAVLEAQEAAHQAECDKLRREEEWSNV